MVVRGALLNTDFGRSTPPATVAAVDTNCLRVIPPLDLIRNTSHDKSFPDRLRCPAWHRCTRLVCCHSERSGAERRIALWTFPPRKSRARCFVRLGGLSMTGSGRSRECRSAGPSLSTFRLGQPRADVMTSWIAIFGYACSELTLPSLTRTEESRSRVPRGSIRSLPPSNWCQTISSPSNTCQRPPKFSRHLA